MNVGAHGKYAGKRLVVFGCGYIGAAVAEMALEEGLHVTALTRNQATALILRGLGIETVVADLASADWHDRIAGGPDLVLNSVGSGRVGLAGYRRSYLAGMESILRWAHDRGPAGTLVYTSSTAVYPHFAGARVTEDELRHNVRDARADHGDSADRLAALCATERRLSETSDACTRWFVLRLAGIYGPGRHQLLEQVRAGEVSGTGARHLNLVHRDDVVAAVWACFNAPPELRNETFNVADDGAATKREIVDWLAQQIGVPAPRFSGSAPLGRPATPDRIVANDRLKSRLDWHPRFPTFREGYAAILGSTPP